MELVIVPVTLLVGMALVYWGVNGTPNTTPQMVFASTLSRATSRPRRAYTPPLASPVDEPKLPDLDLSPSSLRQSDVLLADLMTEMLELRAEITKINARLAALAAEKPAEPAKTAEPVKTTEPRVETRVEEPRVQRPLRRRTTRAA